MQESFKMSLKFELRKGEGFVFSVDVEDSTLGKVQEMPESKVNNQQLIIKVTVIQFGRNQLLGKKETDFHCPSMNCSSTSPTARLDASVVMEVAAVG